jgi:anaerobic selenocysteine-containing dehydrogenase
MFIAEADARAIGVSHGDRVVVRSRAGTMRARVHIADVRPGNVQVFFPEGNVLVAAGRRDRDSGVPDYNAIVTVERA